MERLSVVGHRDRFFRESIVGKLGFLIISLLFLVACRQEGSSPGPKYGPEPSVRIPRRFRVAVHPLHNPTKLTRAYQPLIDYLNRVVKGPGFILVASRNYGDFEEKIHHRQPELLLPNPWQSLEAMRSGYSVIAMAGSPEDFRGIFIVRKDSEIVDPTDLKGKSVSYPSHTALAACIMPQYFLHTHGVKVMIEVDHRYVGSQESTIMNVYLKKTAAGATWPTPWRAFQREHPIEAATMKVIWETPSLINNSFMVRNDLPLDVVKGVREALTSLHLASDGQKILSGMEIARFQIASDADYEIVREYVSRFEREVRMVTTP